MARRKRLVHPHLHKRRGGFAFGNVGHLVQHVHKWGQAVLFGVVAERRGRFGDQGVVGRQKFIPYLFVQLGRIAHATPTAGQYLRVKAGQVDQLHGHCAGGAPNPLRQLHDARLVAVQLSKWQLQVNVKRRQRLVACPVGGSCHLVFSLTADVSGRRATGSVWLVCANRWGGCFA